MAWRRVGSVSFSPFSERLTVGAVRVPQSGGLRVKLRQTTATPFQYGYAILSYLSSAGMELGSVRVWPKPDFASYWLGEGLTVADPFGVLLLEPRTWNLRWVRAGFSLGVSVLADVDAGLPEDRFIAPAFADPQETALPVTSSGNLGRLIF